MRTHMYAYLDTYVRVCGHMHSSGKLAVGAKHVFRERERIDYVLRERGDRLEIH
jgi:hypothetical protein